MWINNHDEDSDFDDPEEEQAMREIRFRAWDKQGKKILSPLSGILWGKPFVPTDYVQGLFGNDDIPENYEYCFEGEMMRVNDCELMQFTGLKDKQGKDIYEGDIIKVGDMKPLPVIFEDGAFRLANIGWCVDKALVSEKLIKIIGSIYETPELLPQK